MENLRRQGAYAPSRYKRYLQARREGRVIMINESYGPLDIQHTFPSEEIFIIFKRIHPVNAESDKDKQLVVWRAKERDWWQWLKGFFSDSSPR